MASASMIRTVEIYTIPHAEQRYRTVGDWRVVPKEKRMVVDVSRLADWRESFMIGIHEAVEAALCVDHSVEEADVSAFDIAYEKAREESGQAPCGCWTTPDSEPGEDVHAPYVREHQVADVVERLLCSAFGIPWDLYSQHVMELDEEPVVGGEPLASSAEQA